MKKSTLAREEKMNMIQEKLEAGTKEIFTTEKYKTYISTMAKFPEYSINNCILIASQCPTATLVCGYKKWQSEFHRTVNKNEHGIMIIAPVKYKADVEELVYDENLKPVLDEMGKQKKKIVNREFQSFRPAYVFDVQQTSGEPLPTLATMLEESVEGYEQLKEALILISPVQVSFESIEGSANGYYSPAEEKIVVREGMPQLQTIKTLIHEIGHVELKHGSEEDKFDRNTKEIQAESVAFWVAEMIGNGLDTSEYSFGYISGWSKDKTVPELKENLDLIKETADRISRKLETVLSKVKTKDYSEEKEEEERNIRKKSR